MFHSLDLPLFAVNLPPHELVQLQRMEGCLVGACPGMWTKTRHSITDQEDLAVEECIPWAMTSIMLCANGCVVFMTSSANWGGSTVLAECLRCSQIAVCTFPWDNVVRCRWPLLSVTNSLYAFESSGQFPYQTQLLRQSPTFKDPLLQGIAQAMIRNPGEWEKAIFSRHALLTASETSVSGTVPRQATYPTYALFTSGKRTSRMVEIRPVCADQEQCWASGTHIL
jgi:hypothetical protein